MSFKLETTYMDLGDTAIENIFINDFMPMANGTYVKVYLLGFKYAADKDSHIEVNNSSIARHLQIPLDDVLNAWNFWEDKGIIKKKEKENSSEFDYDVEFLSLKQLYIKNNYKIFDTTSEDDLVKKVENNKLTPEELIDFNQNPEVRNMFNNIDYIIRRQTVPREKREVVSWMENYNMSTEMIEEAIRYSVEGKGKRSGYLNYAKGVIRNWYDGGIETMEDVYESYKKYDNRYYNYSKIFKAMGLNPSSIPEAHMDLMDTWFDDYKFELDIILEASKRTIYASEPNLKYLNGILENWYNEGIKTIEDIGDYEEKYKERKEVKTKDKEGQRKPARNVNVKTRFHNFDQRSDKYTAKELEDIAKRKRAEYDRKIEEENKRLRGEA